MKRGAVSEIAIKVQHAARNDKGNGCEMNRMKYRGESWRQYDAFF
jgi:hypothetical protein